MTRKYYLSPFMKAILIIATMAFIFSHITPLLTGRVMSNEFPGGRTFFVVLDVVMLLIIVWRIITPLVEISDAGIKVGVPFFFKTNTAKWDEIEAVVFGDLNTLGFKEKNVKLLLKSKDASTNEILFSLMAVEKADEIIEKLREKVPAKNYDDLTRVTVQPPRFTQKEINYQGLTLTDEGILIKGDVIKWENVRAISQSGLVIAGYGATTMVYAGRGGTEQTLNIKPAVTGQYLDVIGYLIQHAHKASIDPALIKTLEYSPSDAKGDLYVIGLFLSGVILLFAALFIIGYYSPSKHPVSFYQLLAVPFGILPMGISVRLIASRFRAKKEATSKKILWASYINAGAIVSVLIFLALSPFSFNWIMGNMLMKTGHLEQARSHYQSSLEIIPDNTDVLFDMGLLYREKKDYKKAFEYLERSYVKDSSDWFPAAFALLPDMLVEIGQYDNALQWCERILNDHPRKSDVERMIRKKQAEILNARALEVREK